MFFFQTHRSNLTGIPLNFDMFRYLNFYIRNRIQTESEAKNYYLNKMKPSDSTAALLTSSLTSLT